MYRTLTLVLWKRDQAYAVSDEFANDVLGAVRRAITADQNFDAFARIAGRKEILDFRFDDRLFIVSGDDHADQRLVVTSMPGFGTSKKVKFKQEGIAKIDVDDNGRRKPEQLRHGLSDSRYCVVVFRPSGDIAGRQLTIRNQVNSASLNHRAHFRIR